MEKEKTIYVFADFLPFHNELVGTIYVSQTRGKEFYSFEYAQSWLENQPMVLDPDLQLYKGRQYINDDKNIFGIFADSCPDRWGKRLMKRREELRAKKAEEKPRKLLESDYLLGVFDEARMGGLRFKTELDGEYLSLNVDSDNSSIDFDLAIDAALFYGIEEEQAVEIVEGIKGIVKDNWKVLAKKYGISRGEMERMKPAFRECEE